MASSRPQSDVHAYRTEEVMMSMWPTIEADEEERAEGFSNTLSAFAPSAEQSTQTLSFASSSQFAEISYADHTAYQLPAYQQSSSSLPVMKGRRSIWNTSRVGKRTSAYRLEFGFSDEHRAYATDGVSSPSFASGYPLVDDLPERSKAGPIILQPLPNACNRGSTESREPPDRPLHEVDDRLWQADESRMVRVPAGLIDRASGWEDIEDDDSDWETYQESGEKRRIGRNGKEMNETMALTNAGDVTIRVRGGGMVKVRSSYPRPRQRFFCYCDVNKDGFRDENELQCHWEQCHR